MNKENIKYFIVSFDTNIEGLPEHCKFYTKSKYYNENDIKTQVANAIENLNIPTIAKISNLKVSKCKAEECVGLEPIEKNYSLIKTMANSTYNNMLTESLKREGVKHIKLAKLALFFYKIYNFFDDE